MIQVSFTLFGKSKYNCGLGASARTANRRTDPSLRRFALNGLLAPFSHLMLRLLSNSAGPFQFPT